MPEDYALSSATCGVETVDIKPGFKRPINIAVYGHPAYEVCLSTRVYAGVNLDSFRR